MNPVKQFSRLLTINFILAKNGLDQVVVSLRLFSPFRFLVYFNPWNWFRKEQLTRGAALRKTLEELGPIFIKFGQALSTRPDILPPDIAEELCRLQDNVPPFPSDVALTIVEEAYGSSAFEVFEHFDVVPLASASVAQVHPATLKTGEDVVVKILRPQIRRVIERDLSLLKTLASFADRYWVESRRFKPKEIVQEFEHHLLDELNLQREAANGGQLRRNFEHSPLLYVPEIYWDYIRENVLVMERVYGIPVTDLATLKKQGINIKKLAERGLEIFFIQVFRHCFFHADMHPGNIFVSPLHPEHPQYMCVDFGIVGTLSERDKRYLAMNLLAFFNRDYRQVAMLHVESGWVASNTRVDDFESAVRTVCEPIFQKSLKDISFAMLVMQLFQVARRFKMEIQPQLVLLQKTLFAVEGLGRQLYPELDVWTTGKPFLEKWLSEQVGPKAFIRHVRENIPFLVEQLPYMPRLMYDLMSVTKDRMTMDKLTVSLDDQKNQKKRFWYTGFGVGIFFVMAVWSGISYFNWVSPEKMSFLALGAAFLGGVVALMHSVRS